MNFDNSFNVRFAIIGCILSILTVFALGYFKGNPRITQYDEIFYLKHAYSLKTFGVYAYPQSVLLDKAPMPGGVAAPLQPAMIALLMKWVPSFDELSQCHLMRMVCSPKTGPVRLSESGYFRTLIRRRRNGPEAIYD